MNLIKGESLGLLLRNLKTCYYYFLFFLVNLQLLYNISSQGKKRKAIISFDHEVCSWYEVSYKYIFYLEIILFEYYDTLKYKWFFRLRFKL